MTMDQLKQEDTETPYIKGMVMRNTLNHFGSHILKGPTKSVPLLHITLLNTPPEVTNLQDVIFTNQEIFGLYISVDKAIFV